MSLPTTSIRLNSAIPTPPTDEQNIVFQSDNGTPLQRISAYDPVMVADTGSGGEAGNVPAPPAGSAAAGKFLRADATWAVPPGSGGGLSGFTDEEVTVTGTSGTLSHTPAVLLGIYDNGKRLRSSGSSPEFSITGATFTLSYTPSGTHVFVAVYFTSSIGGFTDEEITITGTSGAFSNVPTSLLGLYQNGKRLRSSGTSPEFSFSGTAITLNYTPGGTSNVFVAVYFH